MDSALIGVMGGLASLDHFMSQVDDNKMLLDNSQTRVIKV
jgi:hypothetical protein